MVQEQLRAAAMQLNQFQGQKSELEKAKAEVEAASGKVYVTMGGVIVETSKEKALGDIKERSELADVRIGSLTKQYNELKAKEKQLGDKLHADVQAEPGIALMRNVAFSELCGILREYRDKKVLLTFHSIGDRDGVGSAVALASFFTEAAVVTPDFITNNAKKMLEYVGHDRRIEARFHEDADLAIIWTRTRPRSWAGSRSGWESSAARCWS